MSGHISNSQLQFEALLGGETARAGMIELLEWLEASGFYECPASTKYHGVYSGGLADHSLNVFIQLLALDRMYNAGKTPKESIIIAGLLHDVCKVGAYIQRSEAGDQRSEYAHNKEHPAGHAELSIQCLEGFIELTGLERSMIRFHMGVYGCREFSAQRGEYGVLDLSGAIECIPVKLMHFADQLATLDEQAGSPCTQTGGQS
jgi:hypothetical protein